MKLGTKTAPMTLPITAIVEQIESGNILTNYSLQRESNRWSLIDKSNEISDILQNNIFPNLYIAERVNENDVPIMVLIDGLQRVSNAISYRNDEFKVSKKVDVAEIAYAENGEIHYCNIAGKKFSQLPKELQKKFDFYQFDFIKFLNCTDDEVQYHMTRLNRGVRMNNSEKTVCYVGEQFAIKMRDIMENSFFCIDHDNYSAKERTSSAVAKTILECIMIINHFNDWKSRSLAMGQYINEHSSEKEFDDFYELSEGLDSVITNNVRKLFTTKNSFLFFKLLAKYHEVGLTDKDFVDFMEQFINTYHASSYGGLGSTWDELLEESRSNRDTSVITKRLEWLYAATKFHFGINIPDYAVNTRETNGVDNNVDVKNNIDNETESNTYKPAEIIEEYGMYDGKQAKSANDSLDQDFSEEILDSYYYDLVGNSDLIKSIGFSKSDVREIANMTMALNKNMSLEELKHCTTEDVNTSDYMEIKENLNVVDEISLNVDEWSDFFQIENIAVLINIAQEAFKLEVSDKDLETFVVKYINSFSDSKLTGSYIERFETLSKELKTFINTRENILMVAS